MLSFMNSMKKALVCGAGGFIGHHLVKRLKDEGYWIRGVDIKYPEFSESFADDFKILDLREKTHCEKSLWLDSGKFDEVYQLAADMGGMGFIHSQECDIMKNNILINVNMIDSAIAQARIPNYFYSSSVCVYRNMKHGEPEMSEDNVYPALPDNEYGWEKLYSERMAQAFGRKYGTRVRIARFQNTYGPFGTWQGGREKAPAAMCRKVAFIKGAEGAIDVWGDGTAVRSYTYVDDLVDGIFKLMHSPLEGAVNIGCPQYVSVNDLARIVGKVAGKNVTLNHISGPIGVESRNFSNGRIYSTGWKSQFSLEEGIKRTYPWIEQQVKNLNK